MAHNEVIRIREARGGNEGHDRLIASEWLLFLNRVRFRSRSLRGSSRRVDPLCLAGWPPEPEAPVSAASSASLPARRFCAEVAGAGGIWTGTSGEMHGRVMGGTSSSIAYRRV